MFLTPFLPPQSADCLEWLHFFQQSSIRFSSYCHFFLSFFLSSSVWTLPLLLLGTAYLYIDLVYCFISGLGYCKVDKDLSKGWHLGSFLTSYLQILSLKSMPYLLCCIDNPLDIAKVWFLIFLFDVEIMMWVLFCEW